jgi:hypothetical protein
MSIAHRLKPATGAAFKHLLASVLMALVVATLVFGLWYPNPYGELAGGQDLFLLLMAVDVVCGPLLTLVIYNPRKLRAELVRDIGLVVLIQLAALGYGLHSLMQARPVWLAFEGDRYRVVSVPDVDPAAMSEAAPALRHFGLTGPQLVGVRLAQATDPDFPKSVRLSLDGLHPAFRPSRWVAYDSQRAAVTDAAKPLAELQSRYPQQAALIDSEVRRSGLTAQSLGFLPLMAEGRSDWVVLVRLADGEPVGYLPLDGWED